jgi:hypothetical protein
MTNPTELQLQAIAAYARGDFAAERTALDALALHERDSTFPIRRHSAKGQPPAFSSIARRCHHCGADFLALAPGKTGLRGIWHDSRWSCSLECAPPAVAEYVAAYIADDPDLIEDTGEDRHASRHAT